jgi:uncharacterized protein (UPF0332 family)
MNDIMPWSQCKKEFIREVSIDKDKIDSVLKAAEKRLKYIESTKPNEENISFVVEGYYEVIKELLVALLLKNGLKSKNHQCLISFFYNNYKEYEKESYLIAQLSYLRNRLNYYGELINYDFYKININELRNIIKLLNSLILK